jgi:hypothetical protein
MARRPAIVELGARLDAAAAVRDWDALAAATRALALALPPLAAQGAWTEAERVALGRLHAAHQHAYDACSQEKESLGLRLSDMQTNKAGWIAYALGSEAEPDRNQA